MRSEFGKLLPQCLQVLFLFLCLYCLGYITHCCVYWKMCIFLDLNAEMLKFTCTGDVLQVSKCLDECIGETGKHT